MTEGRGGCNGGMDVRQRRLYVSERVGPYGLIFMEILVPLTQSLRAKN